MALWAGSVCSKIPEKLPKSLCLTKSRTFTFPPNSKEENGTENLHTVSDGLYNATARTLPRFCSISFTNTYPSFSCCATYACNPKGSWLSAINSLFFSNSSEESGIFSKSHPMSNGELMIHHRPKWASSSVGVRPFPPTLLLLRNPTTIISMSL